MNNICKQFVQMILAALRTRGHLLTPMKFPFSTVQAIARGADDDFLYANSDYRRSINMYPVGL
jgi:gamma-glutamyltranspeptidase